MHILSICSQVLDAIVGHHLPTVSKLRRRALVGGDGKEAGAELELEGFVHAAQVVAF
jgi:hypothetical protein